MITALRPDIITHNNISLEHVATSLAFIPSLRTAPGFYPVLVLGWTLNYEVMFYLAFASVLWLPRRVALLTLVALFLAGNRLCHSSPSDPARDKVLDRPDHTRIP